ncbi:hypothetical protein A3D05_05305 [Candidatus Gottesmanbacteria bacterium RIFCSPHIGHO2_02_FULL_40_24]|uniref:DUF1648 domain-containing protein n=1 Tax=Candidatus Gottesmanbacteria bacterium RIFCSPHIGHO2_01_FULL_40_15 TaxID=1798376 RepID=A0A1F5Z6R0_9BACT|nr:MAG: hypothetical protein A2777_01940 [Candidatus Gottesmanbacteria bacterium RIFCSPHIGHO2_01_FULL_40_15]OGG16448.1 MAG: hypothetical protein A3D05_05305 [Candidatus Gottesmanbacteria bacterium RIFCSPHIGHO2_02_FULL_40_24]OGG22729.1 MAG: hypothetical protein A3B48_02935 [Candidatus Gottesmanbacteria bacterium RIFCSPLOWO2_01_FULL_40_10]OGG25562.1 MAG: hypothetical protein A3E42_04455 [Candidatus Gottesmanbacteria bacterium RIFCSPHIGHO2_12_FULL_40_13]OGG32568.1 MAG: hypothetical protein A3I80_0
MKERIKEVLRDNIIKKSCQVFLIILAFFTATLIWKWKNLPPELPLFYSLPRSEEQLASPYHLLIIIAAIIIIFLLHFFISVLLYRKELLASRILLINVTVIMTALFLTSLKIIFLIT